MLKAVVEFRLPRKKYIERSPPGFGGCTMPPTTHHHRRKGVVKNTTRKKTS